MKLYVFNPDTDLALANNNENYMAPASARRMAEDLAMLPIWYAQPGSAVLAPSAYNAEFLEAMQRMFSISMQLVTKPELPDYSEAQIMPWGWNLALRKHLLKGGILERKLPTTEQLEVYRYFSSRNIAAMTLHAMNTDEDCCGASRIVTDIENCRGFVESCNSCVLKAPWSGSGKGLKWCKGTFTKSIEGWCERILAEQGFVEIEPEYNKVEDFAMEFYSDGKGKIAFVGYSFFSTTASGAYIGNVLTTSEKVEKQLSEYVPLQALVRLRERLQGWLKDVCSEVYTGYLGVDMMICWDEQAKRYHIHPCVEINMRMNMGVVAHMFCENYLAPGKTGRFMVSHHATNEELLEQHEQDLNNHPMVIEDSRLVSGYLPLVPITPKSRYRAYVVVSVISV